MFVNGVNIRHDELMSARQTAPRTRYHHGDLRNAMMAAGVELARAGGPEAVVLREVARRVGVSATAAYRHFSDAEALLEEIKHTALGELAVALSTEVEAVPADGDPGDVVVARLRAAANAYIDFAVRNAGLFLTAFCRTDAPDSKYEGEPFAETDAFRIMSALLDQAVEVGRITPERRVGADIASWSTVHGFATLLADGPLGRHLSEPEQAFVRERTVEVLLRGLTASE